MMRFTIQNLFHRSSRLLIITAALYTLSPSTYAASYLADLEAEANSTDVQGSLEDETTWSHKKQGISESLSKGMTHEEFEQALRDNYYGSFLFYSKLSEWNKKQVYNTYVESNDIEQIRREIKIRMTK